MSIHIKPEETQTIEPIARAPLFAGPDFPKGHLVMGYNEAARCPMLIEGNCSIYEHRPPTCRSYDCCLFAATGIAVDRTTQPAIARRVGEWVVSYVTEESRQKHSILRNAAALLPKSCADYPARLLGKSRRGA